MSKHATMIALMDFFKHIPDGTFFCNNQLLENIKSTREDLYTCVAALSLFGILAYGFERNHVKSHYVDLNEIFTVTNKGLRTCSLW